MFSCNKLHMLILITIFIAFYAMVFYNMSPYKPLTLFPLGVCPHAQKRLPYESWM